MTRKEIENTYNVKDGYIISPGKFENEPIYAPYFDEYANEGEILTSDDNEGSFLCLIDIDKNDKEIFPELENAMYILFEETGDGFCSVVLLYDENEADFHRNENIQEEEDEDEEEEGDAWKERENNNPITTKID